MNSVKHVVAPRYPATQETTTFSTLIGEILSCPKAGEQAIATLLSPEEKATPQNIQARLRMAIQSGCMPSLTAKRLHKLQAALELGRQLYLEELQIGDVLDTPERAANAFQYIAWEPVEKFAVASLDVRHRLLSCRTISSGTVTETLANPRDIFSAVLQACGTRCIVAHNHPSGSVEPSPEDLALTRQLLDASKVIGIPVLDHLIVSQGKVISLRSTTSIWMGYVP
ncbi:JAB domain-containing protein [Nodosilinea nodulosa]|uniref:JAB domain-containing protein n=1 Tax=Nodosilinea nodulosa TaxID=416001 RepID=UPI000307C640|nr:JAB domain-containing protein [Nodosilinea nodulosa]